MGKYGREKLRIRTHCTHFLFSVFSCIPCILTLLNFSIKYFFSKCGKIHKKLRIYSHLQKKSLMKIFIFCAMSDFIGLQFTKKFLLLIFFSWAFNKLTIFNCVAFFPNAALYLPSANFISSNFITSDFCNFDSEFTFSTAFSANSSMSWCTSCKSALTEPKWDDWQW